jgi:hypothetical protein
MPKCYLIGCDLQTTQNRESSSIIRAINQPSPRVVPWQIQGAICVLDVSCAEVIHITQRLTMNSVAIAAVHS